MHVGIFPSTPHDDSITEYNPTSSCGSIDVGSDVASVPESDPGEHPTAPSPGVNPLSAQLGELALARSDRARPLLPENFPRRVPAATVRRDQRPDVRVPASHQSLTESELASSIIQKRTRVVMSTSHW